MTPLSTLRKQYHRGWLWFTISWCTLLTIASQIPGESFPTSPIFAYDKLIHLAVYIPLGFGAAATVRNSLVHRLLFIAAFVAIFGAIDEIHQMFVPGRTSDIRDWQVDVVGGLVGYIVYYLFSRWRSQPAH